MSMFVYGYDYNALNIETELRYYEMKIMEE